MDKAAKEAAMASVKFAEKSPEPPLDALYDYTYVTGDHNPSAESQPTAQATVAPNKGKKS